MIRDEPPTTITGILTGEDPKPFKPRFVRAVLRCAFLAAPMLTLLFAIGAYQLDQHYRVIKSLRVQTQFVEKGGVLIVGTFDKQRNCEFVSVSGRASDGDVAGVTFMDRRPNVSIHAPVKGATATAQHPHKRVGVSIHAPVKGATSWDGRRRSGACGFNPRAREGRDRRHAQGQYR